ncbi:MAG TPA: hypothetical protein VGU71_11975 [Candidatus Dormibacteraeota bacterium]|nr:hypothetical protein [Candidatus Dormibacteraeota bacterium]
MGFTVLVAGVLVLAVLGRTANRTSYIVIGVGAVLVAVWVLQQ